MDAVNRNQLRPTLATLFALGWILIVFVAYLSTHKPFTPAELSGILVGVWRTLIALAILSIAGGIGLAAGVRRLDLPPLLLAAVSAGLGLGLIGPVLLATGALLGVNLTLWLLLLAGGILTRKYVWQWWRCLGDGRRLWAEAGRISRIIMVLIAVLLACQYVVALAPPLQFDALTYHLALPANFIQIGRIVYLPGTIFWGMPEQAEMTYLPAMLAGGPEAATLLGWWIGLLVLAGLFAFTEQCFGREPAWVALAALLSGSALVTSLSSGYVEWQTMLFALSMLACLRLWALDPQRSLLILAGLFAGMALGTKYTAGIAILAGLAAVLLIRKSFSIQSIAADALAFGGAALLITLPWWIRNSLATANPFYPLLFPSGAMNATRLAQYEFRPLAQDWTRLVLLPWLITVLGLDGGMGYSASIGPLLLGLSLPAAAAWRTGENGQRVVIRLCAVVVLSGFAVWAVASQFSGLLIQTRLYFAFFPAWAILCAAGYTLLAQLTLPGLRLRIVFAALIVLALGFNTFFMSVNFSSGGALLAAIDPGRGETYLEQNLGAYQLAVKQINALPAGARVLMLWETRGLECQPRCDDDEIIDRWRSDLAAYQTPAAVVQAWKNQGYTHVLFYRTGADFIRAHDARGPGPAAWDALYATLGSLHRLDGMGGYELYAIP